MTILADPWFVELEYLSIDYQGRIALTEDGVVCQRWDTHSPQSHGYTDPSMFPDATIEEAGNYCRQLSELWPWCYTITSQRWDYCGRLDLLCRK